jgi:hypothetical protein
MQVGYLRNNERSIHFAPLIGMLRRPNDRRNAFDENIQPSLGPGKDDTRASINRVPLR